MKKVLGVLVLAFGLLLVGCELEPTESPLTEEEINQLIETYITDNKNTIIDNLQDEEIESIVEDYLENNKDMIIDELTEEEIELIVLQYFEDNPVENFISTTYDLSSFEEAVTTMIQTAQQGVLGVVAVSEYSGGTGSGVVYKKDGTSTYYLVTNEHVIVHRDSTYFEGDLIHEDVYVANEIKIVYEKNGLLFEIEENVELLGHDVTTDLAVIRFESDEDFNVIPFANSYDVEIGQSVFAIGNPLGFQYYGSVTSGIISGDARYMNDEYFDATLLQHDAPISPGNSGGALLNINGELIGINNMKIVVEDVSNIGFAIPSNTVKRITMDLEDDGIITRPYLGIQTYAYVNDCGLDYGVCVTVTDGGAADAAGLIDDDIIVGYKNEDETEFLEINNFNDLREAILNSSVGETIVIKYIRFELIEGVLTAIEYESLETELNVHPDD